MGFAFTLAPDTSQTDLTTMMGMATATIIVTATNIDGTGTIIGTTTIEIMIGTTTGIDSSRVFSRIRNFLDVRDLTLIRGKSRRQSEKKQLYNADRQPNFFRFSLNPAETKAAEWLHIGFLSRDLLRLSTRGRLGTPADGQQADLPIITLVNIDR